MQKAMCTTVCCQVLPPRGLWLSLFWHGTAAGSCSELRALLVILTFLHLEFDFMVRLLPDLPVPCCNNLLYLVDPDPDPLALELRVSLWASPGMYLWSLLWSSSSALLCSPCLAKWDGAPLKRHCLVYLHITHSHWLDALCGAASSSFSLAM